MPSPPKPWENRGQNNSSSFSLGSNTANSFTGNNTGSSSSTQPPPATDFIQNPTLPASSSSMNGAYGNSSYGTGYGSYNSGYGSTYGSNYGSYGNMYGSGYGTGYGTYGSGTSYGSGYGYGMGYGSSYGMPGGYGSYGGYNRYLPYSRYGMGPGTQGMPGRINSQDEPSFAAQMAQSTQSTFQLLERVVGTFGGVAQMFESTFFATHSSFMAMVGVAEQFGMLKQMLFQILSLFSLYRWLRNFLYRCIGKRPPIDPREITSKEFKKFSKEPNYSFRPFVMFLALVFGVPYLLHLFMRAVARRLNQQQQEYLIKQQSQVMGNLDNGLHTFEFAQATHAFAGENPSELVFSKGDLIAILSKGPPGSDATQPQWWQGRLRDGRVGMFPSNRVEIIDKKVDLSNSVPVSTQLHKG